MNDITSLLQRARSGDGISQPNATIINTSERGSGTTAARDPALGTGQSEGERASSSNYDASLAGRLLADSDDPITSLMSPRQQLVIS